MNANEKVTLGAEWLDKHFPGWEREINLGTLNLNDCTACICGQSLRKFVGDDTYANYLIGGIFSGYDFALAAEFSNVGEFWARRDMAQRWAIDHGFYPDDKNKVEEAWVALIKERFASGLLSDEV